MKFIISILAIIATAKASPVGSDPCTWGPSYWCTDLGSAEKCGATQFCTENVWATPPPKPLAADPLCEICELVIATAKNALGKNISAASLEEVFDKVCGILPKTIQSECMDLIKQYVPDLIQAWDGATPQVICGEAKVCSAAKAVLKAPKAGPTCAICELAIKEIESALGDNATQKEIIDAVSEVCTVLPETVKDECEQLIQNYGAQIIAALIDQDPAEVCGLIDLCSSEKVVAEVVAPASNGFCVICELAIKEIESTLGDNATEKEIIDAVSQVCTLLPGTVEDECEKLIQDHGAEIIAALIDQDPDEVCGLIDLCSLIDKVVAEAFSPADNSSCALCEFAIKEVQQLIGNNATEQQIIDALEQVCDILPSSIKDECTSLISTYGKQILEILLQDKPEAACSLIGLCDSILPYLRKGEVFLDPQL